MAETLNDLVSQNSGAYPDRISALANDNTQDLLSQLVNVTKQQNELALQERQLVDEQAATAQASPLGLKEAILTALGLGTAAAVGGAQGGQIATGALSGVLGGAEARKRQKLEGLDAQLEGVQSQRSEVAELLDKQRQRLVTLLQSRPDMFIDPESGKPSVDPRLIGVAATGFMIPIDPSVNYTLQKRSAATAAQVELAVKNIMDGETPDQREQGVRLFNDALELNLSAEFVDAVRQEGPDGVWDKLLSNDDLDPVAVINARAYAVRDGKNWYDPDVLEMLRSARTQEASSIDTIPKLQIQIMREIDTFAREAGIDAAAMPIGELIDLRYQDDPARATLAKDFLQTPSTDGVDNETRVRIMLSAGALFTDMFLANPDAAFFKRQGIETADQLWDKIGDFINSSIVYVKQANAEKLAGRQGRDLRRLMEAYASLDDQISLETAWDTANDAFKKIKEESFDANSGMLDTEKYDQLMGEELMRLRSEREANSK